LVGRCAAGIIRGVLFGSVVCCLLAHARAQEKETLITGVELRGLERNDPTVVLSKLQSKEGRPYSKETIEADVRRLYATGLFTDIDLREEPAPEGVRLVFLFQENEILEDIVFLGLKSLKEREIKKDLRLQIGDIFNQYYLKQDIESMREKYLEKGYPFIEIQPKTRAGAAGLILEYIIREGPEVYVEELEIKGNRGFDDGDVEEVMETKENALFSSRPFVERKLKNDLVRIKKYYRSEGYLDVEVYLEDLHYSDDKSEAFIKIRVDEGLRYKVKKIRLEGNTLYRTDEVLEKLKTKPEDYYEGNKLDKDVTKVRDLYGEKAYINTDVNIDLPIAEDKGYVDLVLSIKEGQKSWIDKIKILGNTKTRDYVIRRVVSVYPGEEMNMVQLRRSMKRLEASQFFEQAAVRWEEGRDEEHKDVIIELTEGSTGAIRFGGGFSSNFGFLGLFELTQKNFDLTDLPKSLDDMISGEAFAGAGQFFRATFQPGEKRTRWGVDFREPWFFGNPIGFNFSLFGFRKDREFFTEDRTGGSIGFDKRFGEELEGLSVALGYRLEKITVYDIDDDAPPEVQDVKGSNYLSALDPKVSYDQRDSGLFPTDGYQITLANELAGGPMGGDFDYFKTNLDADYFFTLHTTESGGKHVLVFSAKLGHVTEIAGAENVPIFERFFGGGTGSVRGFQFRTISPKENGNPVGGNAQFFLSAEFTLPIYRTEVQNVDQDILRGALFIDTGNVQKSFGNMDMNGLRVGAGFGLRFTIPQLGSVPVSLDFGFPLKKQDDDDEQFVHLNLGYNY